MSKELYDNRKEEIIKACEKLYETENFKDITIKNIAEATSFSRPSIYNYFQTKEEIFLAILQREYEKWIVELEKMCNTKKNMTNEIFASELAHTIEKRTKLLKLLSMNIYDMEENSRIERLIEFKTAYGKAITTVKKCLDKFFIYMKEEEKQEFLFSFFPFMFGIYPYTFVTNKQKEAMEKAQVPYQYLSVYEITYKGVLKLLK